MLMIILTDSIFSKSHCRGGNSFPLSEKSLNINGMCWFPLSLVTLYFSVFALYEFTEVSECFLSDSIF